MSVFGAEVEAAIAAAVRPSAADLVEGRTLALDELTTRGTRTELELHREWLRRRGLGPGSVPDHVPVGSLAAGRHDLPATDHPLLISERLHYALGEVLAELFASGAITTVESRDSEHLAVRAVRVHGPSNREPVVVPWPVPNLSPGPQARWRLVRPDRHPRELLTASELLEGLDELLGPRGLRCLEEAHHAYRAGLWLASANLVGAASEAAWFSVARAVGVGGIDADSALATVIAKTDRAITTKRREMPGLLATAHYLRDVRNYGLHPRDEHDADREVPFTEAGCAMLLLSSRRYFVQLAALHRRHSA